MVYPAASTSICPAFYYPPALFSYLLSSRHLLHVATPKTKRRRRTSGGARAPAVPTHVVRRASRRKRRPRGVYRFFRSAFRGSSRFVQSPLQFSDRLGSSPGGARKSSGVQGPLIFELWFVPHCISLLQRFPSQGFFLTPGHRVLTPCLLYTSPSPRDGLLSRMPSSA